MSSMKRTVRRGRRRWRPSLRQRESRRWTGRQATILTGVVAVLMPAVPVALDRYAAQNANFVLVVPHQARPHSGPRRAKRAKQIPATRRGAPRGYQGAEPRGWLEADSARTRNGQLRVGPHGTDGRTGDAAGQGVHQRRPHAAGPFATSPVLVFAVDGVEATIERITRSGGTVVGEIMDVPNVGRYARVKDTEGNVIGIIKPVMP